MLIETLIILFSIVFLILIFKKFLIKIFLKPLLFEFGNKLLYMISEKIKEVYLTKSLKSKIIEVVSKDFIEQFSIYSNAFKAEDLNPKDSIHLGNPIDFIVFDGLSEKNLKRIVFVEVKSNENSSLSEVQEQVKKLIEDKKVEFKTISFIKDKIVEEEKIKDLIEENYVVDIGNKLKKEDLEEFINKFIEEKTR